MADRYELMGPIFCWLLWFAGLVWLADQVGWNSGAAAFVCAVLPIFILRAWRKSAD